MKDKILPLRILKDGDSILFSKDDYGFLGCCDCELTHKIDVKMTKNGVRLFFHRDERRTAQRRRRKREQEGDCLCKPSDEA